MSHPPRGASLRPVVHVLAPQGGPLYAVLIAAVDRSTTIRLWEGVPPAAAVRPCDVLLVDVNEWPRAADPACLRTLLERTMVCLVVGSTLIAPAWVEIATRPNVRVVSVGGRRRYDDALSEVLLAVQGPSGEQITDLVLASEPALVVLEPFVRAVCLSPWRVRRPRDLAEICGLPLSDVKRCCATLEFGRVEHFIVCVRAVAYERLVVDARVSPTVARRLSGFGDPSNMRRHIKRATQRSPRAASILKTVGA